MDDRFAGWWFLVGAIGVCLTEIDIYPDLGIMLVLVSFYQGLIVPSLSKK